MRVIVEVELTRTSGPPQHIDKVRDGFQASLRDGIDAEGSTYDVAVLALTKRAGLPTPAVSVSERLVAVRRDEDGHVVIRATRSGNPAQVWELTSAGVALARGRGLTPWTRSA